MAIVRWVPRKNMNDFADEFHRMWDDFFPTRWETRETMWQPRVDVNERKNDIMVTVEVPGMTEKDIKVTLKENHLVISGEKKMEEEHKEDEYHCCERRYGKFERAFMLPTEVVSDKVEAKVKDGILKVTLPKAEKVKAKEITVNA
ncbi:Hsp20 family protein [candidate division KSB1 bacterium]|nr:Hsp20 family protein [candidate division KSB1 bacterium]